MRLAGAIVLSALVCYSASGITLYDNTPGPGESAFFANSSPRTSAGDDVFFSLAGSPRFTSMQFGYFVTSAGTFDAHITFWGAVNAAAASGQPVFSSKLAETTTSITPGGFGLAMSGPIDLTGLPNGGVIPIDEKMGIQIDFRLPGTTTLVPSDSVSPTFDGSGVNLGASDDIYWRDINANQQITGEEARNFGGGAGSLANFTLRLEGVIPEPHVGAILAAAAVFCGAFRRKRQD
jgi:hypothetical protein